MALISTAPYTDGGTSRPSSSSSLFLDRAASSQRDENGHLMDASFPPGEQAAAISKGMVTLMRKIAGRGPERARTTIGRDHVLVMFRETLTEGERNLVDAGKEEQVRAVRAAYQELLRADATKLIEETLYREVIGFMSANHFEPDVAAEVFILNPMEDTATEVPQEAEHHDA
jgi:uncharacterized protein YbcI